MLKTVVRSAPCHSVSPIKLPMSQRAGAGAGALSFLCLVSLCFPLSICEEMAIAFADFEHRRADRSTGTLDSVLFTTRIRGPAACEDCWLLVDIKEHGTGMTHTRRVRPLIGEGPWLHQFEVVGLQGGRYRLRLEVHRSSLGVQDEDSLLGARVSGFVVDGIQVPDPDEIAVQRIQDDAPQLPLEGKPLEDSADSHRLCGDVQQREGFRIVQPMNNSIHLLGSPVQFKICVPYCGPTEASVPEVPEVLVYVNGQVLNDVQLVYSEADAAWEWVLDPPEYPEMMYVEMSVVQDAGGQWNDSGWQSTWFFTTLDSMRIDIQDVTFLKTSTDDENGSLSALFSIVMPTSLNGASAECQNGAVVTLNIDGIAAAQKIVPCCSTDTKPFFADISADLNIPPGSLPTLTLVLDALRPKPGSGDPNPFSPLDRDEVRILELGSFRTRWERLRKRFSSFECIQGFRAGAAGFLGSLHPGPPAAACILHDVCWKDRAVQFYTDPAEISSAMGLSILGYPNGLVVIPGVEGKKEKDSNTQPVFWGPNGAVYNRMAPGQWSPTVKVHPRWEALEYSNADVFALDMVGNAYNFGHFILDQVLPIFVALQAFGLEDRLNDVRLVMRWSCWEYGYIFDHVHGQTPQPKAELCHRNYFDWLQRYFLHFPPVVLSDPEEAAGSGVCFKRLLVGHNMGFSQLSSPHNLFAPAARLLRNRVLDRLQLAVRLPVDGKDHAVLVLIKQEGWLTSGLWPSVCTDVQAALSGMGVRVALDASVSGAWDAQRTSAAQAPFAALRCVDPAQLELGDQAALAARSTTVVTPHGTVSYLALFAPDGASALVAGHGRLKETEALLTLSSLYVLYFNLALDEPHLRSFLLRCMRHSALRFNLWSM